MCTSFWLSLLDAHLLTYAHGKKKVRLQKNETIDYPCWTKRKIPLLANRNISDREWKAFYPRVENILTANRKSVETMEKSLSPMKIKKSKHVLHDRGYTPVVNCKLTNRRLVCGTETDIQGVAVAVAHPQKVDIEQMAHDISHATTATPTDVKLVWDALRTVITDALGFAFFLFAR